MVRQRHWVNSKEPGYRSFVTATCLDFAHLFARPELRTLMTRSLLETCKREEATLHAFVTMTHHFHALLTPRQDQTISDLMRCIKSISARQINPLLREDELRQLAQQTGLGGRTLWQRGFRGLAVTSEEFYWQKLNYIHANPVRANLVTSSEEYLWSSKRLYEAGLLTDIAEVDLERALELFRLT